VPDLVRERVSLRRVVEVLHVVNDHGILAAANDRTCDHQTYDGDDEQRGHVIPNRADSEVDHVLHLGRGSSPSDTGE
jgi:hypothetical protein